MSYDERCDELARVFLDGENPSEPRVAELAQVIQDAIEGWLSVNGLAEMDVSKVTA